ncbi:MAG TPA: GAF domain-containing protein, partial [Anaerolineales bacterium]|nr:GAF domain-containing protein [Anaerolineales bacterium]
MAVRSKTAKKTIRHGTGKKNSNQQLAISSQTVGQVRQLAWMGQHAQAIDLVTQVLSTPKIKPAEQMDLLDLRAESYIALGNLDLAMKDAKAMGKIAKTVGARHAVPLQTQALNRLALVQMRLGELRAAVKSATTAVKTTHNSPKLRAQSLFRLSEAQFRTRQGEAAIETAQKAIALFQELGDLSGAGRAHWSLASALNQVHPENARHAAQTASELCRKAGDQYGIGNALNALNSTDADIAEAIQHAQQAHQAFETSGYVERQATVLGNLALSYMELGLYAHSRRIQNEVTELDRTVGGKLGLAYDLGNLLSVEIPLGELASARLHLQELESLVSGLGDPSLDVTIVQGKADIAFVAGDIKAAIRHHQSAMKIAPKHDRSGKEIASLIALGKLHLAQHNSTVALKLTTKATAMHQAQSFPKLDSLTSQAIWWWHAQILNANQKTQAAREAMDRAYDFLLESIVSIRDEGLRRNALNKVEDTRKLLQFWVRDGVKRKLPNERLFAHLSIESNLRDPFKRLAYTSLRLNTLKTIREIQTFLVEEATELSGGERVMLILEKDGKREVMESILPLPSYFSGKGYEPAEDPKKILASIQKYLEQARLTRTVQLTLPKKSGLSRIVAPLIAQNQVSGYVYVDMDSLYGTFDETDRNMLSMLANQAAVALDNAQWAQGLEQKVEERTEQLNQRVDELAILNSVGEAMAKTLDVKTVVKIVGDKVQSIFAAEIVSIRLCDPATNLIQRAYDYERGYEDLTDTSFPMGVGLTSRIIKSGKPMLLGTYEEQMSAGAFTTPSQHSVEDAQTYMGVPIFAGKHAIGVVSVQNYKQYAYNENDVRLLETLASNMGVAIQNARLFEAEQERVAELQIINSIQQGLAAELDFQAIVDLVGDKLREVFNTPDLGITWYDEKANLVHYLYFYEHGRRITTPATPPNPGGIYENEIRTRRPLVLNNEADFAKINMRVIPGTDQAKSVVIVPIISSDRFLGDISMENFERENAYGESELRLLTTIAASLGTALENARLFDETQRLLKITEERNAELAIINSVQAGLVAKMDIQGIYDLVGDKIRETFDAQVADIGLYDRQNNLIHFPYIIERGVRFPSSPLQVIGYRKHVIETHRYLLINENTTEVSAKYGNPTAIQGEMPKSVLYVPMVVGDEAKGVISLQNLDRESAFSESDVRLLQTLANSMSVALENARLFDETQRLLKETEQRNAELAIINSVQAALAAELNIQGIYDAVGDKVREIFDQGDVGIRIYDPKTNLVHYPYAYEHGERISIDSNTLTQQGFASHVFRTRETVVINENIIQEAEKYGSYILPGTDVPKSQVMVPLVAGDQARGLIEIVDMQLEHAFTESDVRLLQTLANSMSVALENARLFDETQQRNAELAIINSVQASLAAKLDMQAIYDAVGNKIQEIFDAQVVMITTYDKVAELVNFPYTIEKGERLQVGSLPISGISGYVIKTGKPVMISQNLNQAEAEILGGSQQPVAGEAIKSRLDVPMITGD